MMLLRNATLIPDSLCVTCYGFWGGFLLPPLEAFWIFFLSLMFWNFSDVSWGGSFLFIVGYFCGPFHSRNSWSSIQGNFLLSLIFFSCSFCLFSLYGILICKILDFLDWSSNLIFSLFPALCFFLYKTASILSSDFFLINFSFKYFSLNQWQKIYTFPSSKILVMNKSNKMR